jgi:2-iminobutanoate/2-iminopropanoate deaminase
MTAAPTNTPPFPAAVRHGDTIYTSGLAALDPSTLQPTSADFDTQCADVLAQLDAALATFDVDRAAVLKLECYLADRAYFASWHTAFAGFFGASPPARTTTVTTLPVDGLLIEIQVVAATSKDGDHD